MSPSWPDEDDEEAAQPLQLLQDLERLTGAACVVCADQLCGHEALFSVAMGFKNAPRCLTCLARLLDREVQELRDHLVSHFKHRSCFGRAWGIAGVREGFGYTWRPGCLWSDKTPVTEAVSRFPMVAQGEADEGPLLVADTWDAGDLGCGDLVLALRGRLQALPPAAVLRVIARDPAAPEDLPAWCRLTGHHLRISNHPEYLIQRKE